MARNFKVEEGKKIERNSDDDHLIFHIADPQGGADALADDDDDDHGVSTCSCLLPTYGRKRSARSELQLRALKRNSKSI